MAGILARRELRYRGRVVKVLIGLGGNLGDPPRAFATALRSLARAHDLRAWSRLHRTRAVGPPQPDYWNLAAVVHCACDPAELLALCHELERAAGRRREGEARWGPRPLDLDLLLVDGVVSDDPALTLPHPRFHERLFALLPAAEVAPHWRHQVLGATLGELARDLWQAELSSAPARCGLGLPSDRPRCDDLPPASVGSIRRETSCGAATT